MYSIKTDPLKNRIHITLGTPVTYRETTEKYGYIVGLAETVQDADTILDHLSE